VTANKAFSNNSKETGDLKAIQRKH